MQDDMPQKANPIITPTAGPAPKVAATVIQPSATVNGPLTSYQVPKPKVVYNNQPREQLLENGAFKDETIPATTAHIDVPFRRIWLSVGASLVALLLIAGGVSYWGSKHNTPGNNSKLGPVSSQDANNTLQYSLNSADLKINRNTIISNGKKFSVFGNVAIQNEADSSRAFYIQDAKGNNLFVADTQNKRVGIGEEPTGTAALQVAGDISVKGKIISSDGNISVGNDGIRIGSVLVCTARGCISSSSPAPTPTSPTIDVANVAFLNKDQSFSGSLNFNGSINATAGLNTASLKVNGVPGASLSCAPNEYIKNPTVSSGVITNGICNPGPGVAVATIQEVYNASTPADFTLNSSNGLFGIRDGVSPLGTNLFEVSNNSGVNKYFAVSSGGVAVLGNVNTTGQYQVNGTQISSADLSNNSNLAKLNGTQTFTNANTFSNASNSFTGNGAGLTSVDAATLGGQAGSYYTNAGNISSGTLSDSRLSGNVALLNGSGPQTFTGNNKFTGTIIAQNSANSTNAFQIQNTAGTSNLFIADTTNSRVAINQASAAYALDVAGDINSTTGIRVGGTLICSSGGCLAASGSGSYIQNGTTTQTANFNIRSNAAGSVAGVFEGASGQSADILDVQNFGGGTKYFSVNSSGIGVAGNANVTGQYQVNGSQISSANLSNDSNLAKVNGNTTFTGNNTFTGTVLSQNASNSTSAFQIQNSLGTSNLFVADTVNTRIAIGQASANYPLDVAGDINSTTGIRVGGTLICSSGGCLAASGSGSYIQNGTTTQTGNFNIRSNAAGSVAGVVEGASGQSVDIFDVQGFGGGTKYLAVGTGGASISGNVNTTGQYQVNGTQISSANLSNDSNLAKLDANQTFTGNNTFSGTVLAKNTADSAAAFQVQDSAANTILAVDTAAGKVQVKANTSNSANAFSVIDGFGGSNIFNVDTVNNSGQVSIRLGANPGAALAVGSDSAAIDIFKVIDQTGSPGTVFKVADEGAITAQNHTDSTAAFQIQNASGSSLFTADTVNQAVDITGNTRVGNLMGWGDIQFSDGFESGNTSKWTNNPSDGITSVQSSIVHSGRYAAYFSHGGSQLGTSISGNNLYARAWVYVSSQTTASADLFYLDNGGNGNSWHVERTTAGQLCVNGSNCSGSLPLNSWHEIELQVITGAGTGSTNLWLDGSPMVALNSQPNGTSTIQGIGAGDGSASDVIAMYMDDVAVSTVRNTGSSVLSVGDGLNVQGSTTLNGQLTIHPAVEMNNIVNIQNWAGNNLLNIGTYNGNGFTTLGNQHVIVRTNGNTDTAFQVQDSGGNPLFTADTANSRIIQNADTSIGSLFGSRLFSDNFESGNKALWSVYDNNTDIESAVVHNGQFALQFNGTTTSYVSTGLGGSTSAYLRAWVYVASQNAGTTSTVMGLDNGSGNGFSWDVMRKNDTNQICINNSGASTINCGGTFSLGAWHLFELQIAMGNPGTTNLWLDGASIYSSATDNNGVPGAIQRVYAGEQSPQNITGYIDDISVDASSRISASSSLNVQDTLHVGGNTTLGGQLIVSPSASTDTAFRVTNPSNGQSVFTIGNQNSGSIQAGVTTIGTTQTIITPFNDTTSAFQVQNSSARNLFNIDTTGNSTIALGGTFGDGINGGTTLQIYSTSTSDRAQFNQRGGHTTLQFVDTTGTAEGAIQSFGNDNIRLCTGSGGCSSGSILNLGNSSSYFKTGADSTTAFQIQNAAGTSNLFIADTTNTRLAVAKATASYTLDVGGDINTTGIYRVNGTQISSSNLSNDSNLAKLNANQTFTGNNTFTGTVLAKNTADSTTAFQVQNAGGGNLVNIDTTNSYITLGQSNGGINSWSTNVNTASNIYGSGSAIVNGYIYQIGGNGAGVKDWVNYAKLNADGSTSTFSATTSLPQARYYHTVVALNGYIYVIGGYDSTNTPQSTIYYGKVNIDGTISNWSTSTIPLPQTLEEHASVTANGYIYVFGGNNGTSDVSNSYFTKVNPDGSIGNWVATSAMPGSRKAFAVVAVNGYVYGVGGIGGAGNFNNVIYAKLNQTGGLGGWNTSANTLPLALYGTGAVANNGYLYEIGGYDGGTGPQTKTYYAKLNNDGTIGTFSTAANNLPSGVYRQNTLTYNGYVYVLSAVSNSNQVYYAPFYRLQINSNVDLVGLQGGNLSDAGNLNGGSMGGSITAGNITAVGALQVQGQGIFAQGVGITGNLSVAGQIALQNSTNSTTAFQIQNAAGANLLHIDTTTGNQFIAQSGTQNVIDFFQVRDSGGTNILNVDTLNRRVAIGAPGLPQNATLYVRDGNGGGSNLLQVVSTVTGSDKTIAMIDQHGYTIFKNDTDSTTAFQVQNSTGTTSVLNVDTANGRVGIGTNAPVTTLDLLDTNAKIRLDNSVLTFDIGTTANGGTISSNTSGKQIYVGTNNGAINFSTNGSTSNALALASTGSAVFKNNSDSTTAFQVQNASGTSLLTADTANMRLGINVIYTALGTSFGTPSVSDAGAGSLASGSQYYYKITAIDSAGGETTPSAEGTLGTGHTALNISWTAISSASGYKVYRSTSTGAEVYLTTVLTNSFKDTGSITVGSTSPPGSNTAYVSTNTSNSLNQLSIGGLGMPTGQVYVSGTLPKDVSSGGIATNNIPAGVYVSGNYAYVITQVANKLQVFDVTNPTSPADVTNGGVNLSTQPGAMYVSGHYAYVGEANKLQIFDITNPASPADITSGGVSSINSCGMYVQGRYVYIVGCSSNKLQIFDITNPASPADITSGGVSTGTNTYPSSVFVSGRYAYVTLENTNKLRVYDVSNPANPTDITSGGVSTSSTPDAVYVQGRYAYVSDDIRRLQIFDVSNPASPKVLNGTGLLTANDPTSISVQGRYAYITAQSTSKLQVVDVSNPANPQDISGGGISTSTGANQIYIQGRYAYITTASAKTLQIFDLGGIYSQQFQAGGAKVGTLQVDNNGQVYGDFNIQGGLQVGQSLQTSGNFAVTGSSSLQGPVILAGGKKQLGAPTGFTVTNPNNGTGALTAGTYLYEVTAVDTYGNETTVSNEASGITATTNLNLNLTWNAISGASAYKIYRTAAGGSTGTETYLTTVTANSYNDSGAVTLGTATAPTTDTTGQLSVLGSALFKNTNNSTTAFQIQNAAGSSLLTVDTQNTAISLAANTTLAAGKYLKITGDITANRPSSPTAGTLFYDTTTNQLIQYNGSKWVSDRSAATKIVAASNSTQAEKDAADYVASGSGDQATINSALTAAAGGTVYLMEGTYSITAAISVPNNTTLSGAGAGSVITVPNSFNAAINAIVNADTATGTHIKIQNLLIDGNKSNQTAGTMVGINLNGMGAGSGTSARDGAKIASVIIKNMRNEGTNLNNTHNSTVSGSTFQNEGADGIYVAGSYNTITGNLAQGDYNGFEIANDNNTVTGNTAQGNSQYGFYINAYYNSVTGNTSQGNNEGVNFGGGHNTATGNSLTGNVYGIESDSSGNIISGNSVTNSTNLGVLIYGPYNTVSANTVQGNAAQGIWIGDSYNSVTGNDVYSNASYGIYLSGAQGNTVSGNKVHSNSGATDNNGIYLDGTSSKNSITSNDITDTSCTTTCYAININSASATGNYLAANHILGDGTHASTIHDITAGGNTYSNQPLSENGDASFRNGINSTTAFQVQNASGSAITTVDTSNSRLTVSNAAGTSYDDDFNTGGPTAASKWTFYTPDTSSYSVNSGIAGELDIVPSTSASLDCWTSVTNCVRLMQAAPSGNFEAETKINNASPNSNNNQGILVWKDSSNFIRFEYDGSGGFSVHKVIAGVGTASVTTCGAPATPIYEKVIRNGDNWTLFYSQNDSNFFKCGSTINQSLDLTGLGAQIGLEVTKGDTVAWSGADFDFFHVYLPTLKVIGGISIDASNSEQGTPFQIQTGGEALVSLQEHDSNWYLDAKAAAVFHNSTNDVASFQIQNATGTSLFTVDTSNNKITLGSASATPVLLVLGNKNTAGDPTCTNGAIYYNSNSNQFRFCQNGSWTGLGSSYSAPAYVTSLPGSPSDGQEVYYIADSANQIIWHLRYKATGPTYHWEYLGGSPMTVYVSTSESATTSAGSSGYVDLTTVGPSITLPLAGTYRATFGAQASSSGRSGGAGSSISNYMKLNVGGTLSGPDAQADTQLYSGTGTMGITEQIVQSYQFTAASGSTVVKPQYQVSAPFGSGSYSGTFSNRYITIIPIAVN